MVIGFILAWYFLEADWFLLWLITINVVTLLMFAFDKMAAGFKDRRGPNLILQGLVLLGGFGGGWVGVLLIRHKSQKLGYYLVLIISTLIYLGVLNWLCY